MSIRFYFLLFSSELFRFNFKRANYSDLSWFFCRSIRLIIVWYRLSRGSNVNEVISSEFILLCSVIIYQNIHHIPNCKKKRKGGILIISDVN